MTMKVCPNCNAIFSVAIDCTDFVHNCNDFSNITSVAVEDVVKIGDATEFGNTITQAPDRVQTQGLPNPLDGTLAGAEGFKSYKYTPRGNNTLTHRQRDHFEFIDGIKQVFDN